MTDNNCNCGCAQTEQMRCINAKSDFDFILRLYDAEHEVIGSPNMIGKLNYTHLHASTPSLYRPRMEY